jgi:hypothetical protein
MLFLLFLLTPVIYIGVAAVGTAMLPPVDYVEISKSHNPVQVQQAKPADKTPDQIVKPAQDLQSNPASKQE